MKHFYWFLIHLVFGLWLLISPYALHFTDMPGAYWNSMLVGLIFTLSSALGLYYNWGEVAGKPISHQPQRA